MYLERELTIYGRGWVSILEPEVPDFNSDITTHCFVTSSWCSCFSEPLLSPLWELRVWELGDGNVHACSPCLTRLLEDQMRGGRKTV